MMNRRTLISVAAACALSAGVAGGAAAMPDSIDGPVPGRSAPTRSASSSSAPIGPQLTATPRARARRPSTASTSSPDTCGSRAGPPPPPGSTRSWRAATPSTRPTGSARTRACSTERPLTTVTSRGARAAGVAEACVHLTHGCSRGLPGVRGGKSRARRVTAAQMATSLSAKGDPHHPCAPIWTRWRTVRSRPAPPQRVYRPLQRPSVLEALGDFPGSRRRRSRRGPTRRSLSGRLPK